MRTPRPRISLALILASLVVAGSVPATALDTVTDAGYYANQTPYGDPESTAIVKPPTGYDLVLLQVLGRHGSRSQVSETGEKRALAVWSAASKKKALTKVGALFADDVKAFQKAEKQVTYGYLSGVGKTEWKGIGRRTAANYPAFWADVAEQDDTVTFSTTTVHRTRQSAEAFRDGLDLGLTEPLKTDKSMLITNGSSKSGRAAIAKVLRRSDVRTAATHVLRRLYSSTYVKSLKDPVGKALDIYAMYAIAPGMKAETPVTFSSYVPLADARLLGLVKDTEKFYEYGPGVKGETSSYRQARPVLKNFFGQIDARLKGGDTAAVFRLGHGETTIPFAALIKAPGSGVQATTSTPFTYSRNPWRGWVNGRMAGNVEWALYQNAANKPLVTMRYNEQPAKFDSACKPVTPGSYFYEVSALKKCLAGR